MRGLCEQVVERFESAWWLQGGKHADFSLLRQTLPESLFENSVGSCFRGKSRMARRDERAYPPAVCDRGATKPAGLFRENPPGGGAFVRDLRWLRPPTPLRGCAPPGPLAPAKNPARRSSRSF